MQINAIKLTETDNVATVLKAISKGEQVYWDLSQPSLAALSDIPFGHKIAVCEISKGDNIIKYGEIIGAATVDIVSGEHVHVFNIESKRARGDLNEA